MNLRTRVKICGITREQDAICAAGLGADAIGLMFHQPSSRVIEIESALSIRHVIPPFVSITAVFLDEAEDWIKQHKQFWESTLERLEGFVIDRNEMKDEP